MRITLQIEVLICGISIIWYTRPSRSAKPCEFPQQRLQGTKSGEMTKLASEDFVQSKKSEQDVMNAARADNRKVFFGGTLMDLSHLKTCSIGRTSAKHSKAEWYCVETASNMTHVVMPYSPTQEHQLLI